MRIGWLLVLSPHVIRAWSTQRHSRDGRIQLQQERVTVSRRWFVLGSLGLITTAAPSKLVSAAPPVVEEIAAARDTLQSLLDNWSKAVIDCTYADVPRELLETKNKEELLEKASTFALFDKSVSVVSCKTSNRIVRDYLGVTGKGPLVGIDKKLQKALDALDDPDSFEDYLQTCEGIQNSLSRADSLSYAAGVADLGSVNNFDKAEEASMAASSNSNLGQTRKAVQSSVDGLNHILGLLQ